MRTATAIAASAMPPGAALEAIDKIAGALRPGDLDEAVAATGGDPRAILRKSFEVSTHAWIIHDRRGEAIGVMGAAPHFTLPGVGVVWMMGTEGIEREALSIARQTRHYLAEMHDDYHMLMNWVDARNELSLQWLLWSGFHLTDADPAYGAGRRLFYEFARLG